MRLTLSPAGAIAPSPVADVKARGKAGRRPSPATQALIAAMTADGGHPRSRSDYLDVLRQAGHKGSDNSADLIINREAKRIFGGRLGRGRKANVGKGRKGGRQASPATAILREKLAKDKASGELRDAPHYLRWVVDQPGVELGLKQARPIVYRELRQVR